MKACPHIWANASGPGYVASYVLSDDSGRTWGLCIHRTVWMPSVWLATLAARWLAAGCNRRDSRRRARYLRAEIADRALRGGAE